MREAPPADAGSESAAALAAALEQAARQGWGQLDLLVECQHEGRLETARLWGSGVGSWQGSRQFRLPREEVAAILDELRRADFAGMRPTYGGPPASIGIEGAGAQGARIVCRMVLELDGQTKRVAQRKRGEQSVELRRLAEGILERCRERGRAGVGADSLNDGLAKLADGALEPEALRLVVQRRPEGPAAADEAGWLLRLGGRAASVRGHRPSLGYGEPIEVRLGDGELQSLFALLVEADVDNLPVNLWAEQYTDLLVEVLDRRKSLQARRFAGMEPESHGEAQKRFDRLYAGLEALATKLLAGGAATAG